MPPRDEHAPANGPDDRRPSGGRHRAEAAARISKRGRSGYGLESIRPHLHAQLEMQRLLRPQFPPESERPTADAERAWRNAP